MAIPRCLIPAALLAVIMLGFTACAKQDLRKTPIQVTSNEELAAWTATVATEATPDEMQEFDDAIGFIRRGIDDSNNPKEEADIFRILCERINGKTFYQVIILGYQTEIEWQSNELALRRQNVEGLEILLSGLGASGQPIREHVLPAMLKELEESEARLAKAQAGLAAAEKR